MGDDTQAEMIKLFLRTSRVEGAEGVFSIGPFGERVSFASQQRRALNTVWALEQDGAVEEGSKVAVLGAGLAGIMAAAAFAARKCVVHLFEGKPRVLSIQKDAKHRFVHPTINFWPEINLGATTTFPFLDWHADSCSEVIDDLHDEWREHLHKHVNKSFLKSTVAKLDTQPEGIYIKCLPGGDAPARSGPYRVVILAVGFGLERKVKGLPFKSYWQPDDLSDSEGTSDVRTVSGAGDGGLIDALRVVHRNFRRGRLALELVETLRETGIPALLRAAEKRVRDTAGSDRDKAATMYEEEYGRLLDDLPPVAVAPLNESLRISSNDPVLVLGGIPAPYSRTAAPIHKLMLSHAIARKAIQYRQGQLNDGPELLLGGTLAPLEQPCVVRHGPDPKMAGLLTDDQIKSLRERQIVLDDVLAGDQYDGSYWKAWNDYPRQDFSDPAFVSFRYVSAADYVLKEFKLPLTETNDGNGKAGYAVNLDPRCPGLRERLPNELFGIGVEAREPRVFNV